MSTRGLNLRVPVAGLLQGPVQWWTLRMRLLLIAPGPRFVVSALTARGRGLLNGAEAVW